MMEWYQLMYCKPGRGFYETYGGRVNPYKLASLGDVETAITTLMKTYPGCAIVVVKITEALFCDIATKTEGRMKLYAGVV